MSLKTSFLMKKLLLIVSVTAALLTAASCKKAIQQKEENLIIQAVTSGRWYVQLYMDTTTDVTAEFSPYQFQFYQNNTVDAIIGSSTRSTGTWNGDINNYTITATFPANAGDTLLRLNHVWKITDSYTNYVEAQTPNGSKNNILHLQQF